MKEKIVNTIVILLTILAILATGYYAYYKINQKHQIIDSQILEERIKDALIEKIGKTSGLLMEPNSIYAEAHQVLKEEQKENKIYIYAITLIETYIKENGEYISTSGMAGPMTLIFDKNYQFLEYIIPDDGEEYESSLREMFPSELVDEAFSINYKSSYFQEQINSYLH